MQVGEEQLLGAQHRDLRRLQLLDVEDHLGLGEDRRGVGHDPCPLSAVALVADRRAEAGTGLDQHLVTVLDHFAHPGGGDRDAVLVGLDLGGNSYLHLVTNSLARSANQNSIRSCARDRSRPVNSSTLRIR